MFKKCDVNLSVNKPNNTVIKYGRDHSGKNKYKFNSLGFRSEEFNPHSKKRIYVAGCSHTFGTGLNEEETWPSRFKKTFCKIYNYSKNDVNLMNFGMGGQSNDYIARNIIVQCNEVKPDLLVILFTYPSRIEYLEKKNIRSIGIWNVNDDNDSNAIGYYTYYTDEIGYKNLIKNILLVQYFCKAKNIDYIFSLIECKYLLKNKFAHNIACKSLADLLDKKYICDFTIKCLDRAADNLHYGSKSHNAFAENLIKFYSKKYNN